MARQAILKARLILDKTLYDRALKGAVAAARSFQTATADAAKRGVNVLAVATIAAGAALAYGVKKAYDLGSEMSDMRDKTGMAIDQLLILRQAAKDNGLDDITGPVKKMQVNLVEAVRNGVGPAAQALQMLGLNAEDLISKLPTDQLDEIGRKIAAIESPALRTAEAVALFGREGQTMLPLFADSGALTTAAASLGKQAHILKDNASRFDAVSDRLGRSGLKLQGFFVGIASSILPAMESATKRLDAIDLSGKGVKFGQEIEAAAEIAIGAFQHPELALNAFSGALQSGIKASTNLLISGCEEAAAILPGSLKLFNDLWFDLVNIMSGTLMLAFHKPVAYFQAGIEKAVDIASRLRPSGMTQEDEKRTERLQGKRNEFEAMASYQNQFVQRRDSELAASKDESRTPEERDRSGKNAQAFDEEIAETQKAIDKLNIAMRADSDALNHSFQVHDLTVDQLADNIDKSGELTQRANNKIQSSTQDFTTHLASGIQGAVNAAKHFEVRDRVGEGEAMQGPPPPAVPTITAPPAPAAPSAPAAPRAPSAPMAPAAPNAPAAPEAPRAPAAPASPLAPHAPAAPRAPAAPEAPAAPKAIALPANKTETKQDPRRGMMASPPIVPENSGVPDWRRDLGKLQQIGKAFLKAPEEESDDDKKKRKEKESWMAQFTPRLSIGKDMQGPTPSGATLAGSMMFAPQSRMLKTSGLTSGGLSSGSLSSAASSQTPLLRASERRSYENDRVAQGVASSDSRRTTQSAFHVVKRGDFQRARDVASGKERDTQKNMGADISNIAKNTAALVDAWSTKGAN